MVFACFGAGFERLQTHTRTPGLPEGRNLLLDRVTELDVGGGPWGRGYLRAELDIDPRQWFFDGHFKNDPCMPGTLMFDGCLQAMAVCLAAMGHSLERDGWRFQPVPEIPYQLQCRGQVTPRSRLLVTEVFIEEVVAGPVPTVYADLLCTVDGLKAFHARRVALQLVPDWPLRAMPALLAEADADDRPVRGGGGLPLRPQEPARLRLRPALGCLRAGVPAFRRHPARRPPAEPALPVHEPHRRDPRRHRRDAGRGAGAGRVRHPRRRLVFRRQRLPDDAVRGAAGSGPATLRLAVELCRLGADRGRRARLPQSGWRRPAAAPS